ncbi:hypothetical protein ROZALSC1DRAFT_25907, partial [Rozella allomycis CSF55]
LFPDDKKRPDFTIACWNGQFTAFDVSVVSPFTSSNLGKAAGNIGAHLNFAAIKKEEKYSEELSVLGAGFIPLIFDALGGFHDSAVSWAKKVALLKSIRRGTSFSTEKEHLIERISVSLAKYLGFMIVSRAPEPT